MTATERRESLNVPLPGYRADCIVTRQGSITIIRNVRHELEAAAASKAERTLRNHRQHLAEMFNG